MSSALRAGRNLLPACAAAGAAYAYLHNTESVSPAVSLLACPAEHFLLAVLINSHRSPHFGTQVLFSTVQAEAATPAVGLNPNDWTDLKLIDKKKLNYNTFALRCGAAERCIKASRAHSLAFNTHMILSQTA